MSDSRASLKRGLVIICIFQPKISLPLTLNVIVDFSLLMLLLSSSTQHLLDPIYTKNCSSSFHIHSFFVASQMTRDFYPVVIVGAGPSGIAFGCQLKRKLQIDDFRIFERQTGIGGIYFLERQKWFSSLRLSIGTWRSNRYPGVVSIA